MWVFGFVRVISAQEDICDLLVRTALQNAQTACAGVGHQQVCYGNPTVELTSEEALTFVFDAAGATADLGNVRSLRTTALDINSFTWGVALLRPEVMIPGMAVELNLTMVIFGDVLIDLRPTGSEGLNDTQSFDFLSGIGEPGCAAQPPNGILMQSPPEVNAVELRVNNVSMTFHGTLFLQTLRENQMAINVIEGHARVETLDQVVDVPAGGRARIALDNDLNPREIFTPPEPYTDLSALPVLLLNRQLEIAAPMSAADLAFFGIPVPGVWTQTETWEQMMCGTLTLENVPSTPCFLTICPCRKPI
jgi:hypothetical protein